MKSTLMCSWCGKSITRYLSQLKRRNFCSRQCVIAFSDKKKNPDGWGAESYIKTSERMTQMNRAMNVTRMTVAVRSKLRKANLGKGLNKSYAKLYGCHEHRAVAETMIGRLLEHGEVVHHMDRDKRNNKPENLRIFTSQAEHVAWHKIHDKGGDAK